LHLEELESYLHEHIPLSKAMQVSVVQADPAIVILSAPLLPNINHRDTVFGGSASAIAILAAWTILYVRLKQEGIDCRVVIHRNQMNYEKPVAGNFIARAELDDEDQWHKFLVLLRRRRRARIQLTSRIEYEGTVACTMTGDFVALLA